jgi:ribonuclease P protein component
MRPASIKNKNGFDKVFDNGKRYNGELLTLIAAKGSGALKLGIIVNSKFGGAVERNRVKRKIREAFRSVAGKFKENPEIVIIPKGSARRAKTPEILTDLSSITYRAGIL